MRLIYLSPVSWFSFAQRPHKFVEWYHRVAGEDVLWLEPYPARFPRMADIKRLYSPGDVVHDDVEQWLTVEKPRSLPIEPLPLSGLVHHLFWKKTFAVLDKFVKNDACLLVVGKPSVFSLQVLKRYPQCVSIYDAMDDFPAFHSGLSRLSMGRRERTISSCVDRIMVSSTSLSRRFSEYQNKLNVVLNACDVNILPEVENRKTGTPVLGYVGTISRWFDWNLVKKIALTNPSVRIRLIGPVQAPCPEPVPENIELLPPCGHAEAIQAMRRFTVGLIPFKVNELTRSVDPVKYYEYRALGLPVLSTRFGEMSYREGLSGVYIVDGDTDLAAAVDKSIEWGEELGDIEEFRKDNSWDVRFSEAGIV